MSHYTAAVSILGPEGKHGCYGTWQLVTLDGRGKVFKLHKTCTGGYLLTKALQPQFI